MYQMLLTTGGDRREYEIFLGKNREAHGSGQWGGQAPDNNTPALPGCPRPKMGEGEDLGLPVFS